MRAKWRARCVEEPAPYDLEQPCLIWQGAWVGSENFRYPSLRHPSLKRNGRGNRFVFYDAHGYFPETVNHRCDRSLCLEITHLKAGTQAENMRDRAERSPAHYRKQVLTRELVAQIRDLHKHKIYVQHELALLYGVGRAQISHITTGRCWKAA